MKRIVTSILTATEAFGIATAGLAILLVPALLTWLFSYGLAGDPANTFGLVFSLWFFGHGVPLTVAVDPTVAVSFGLPAAAVEATFSLFPLGFMMFTFGLAARAGVRLAAHTLTVAAWGAISSVLTVFTLAFVLTTVTPQHTLGFTPFWAAVMPALIFFLGLTLGFIIRSVRTDAPWVGRLVLWVTRRIAASWAWIVDAAMLGLRIGGTTLATLVAGAALVFAVRLAFSYVAVVSISQQLQIDALGSLVLFMINLSYLPTMLIWVLSWIIGPGFSIGVGSSVSAVSTQLGPVPSLPMLGIVPYGSHSIALGLTLIVVLGATASIFGVLRRENIAGEGKPTLKTFSVMIASAVVMTSLVLAFVMWLGTGSMGPGRLVESGPNPWLVAGIAAAEITVGFVFGAWLSVVDWERVAQAARSGSAGIQSKLPAGAAGALESLGRFRRKPVAGDGDGVVTEPAESPPPTAAGDDTETREIPDFRPWWGDSDTKL